MKTNHDWSRGYFCAVATLINLNGCVNTHERELFNMGRAGILDSELPHAMDKEDLDVFRRHGLMPAARKRKPTPRP